MREREARQPLRESRVVHIAGMLACGLLFAGPAWTQEAAPTIAASAAKTAAVASVDRHRSELVSLSDQVWAFAETALREKRSAKLLADYAAKQGFHVERGISNMPTAFVASYGSGRPVIAIMGEYDALDRKSVV